MLTQELRLILQAIGGDQESFAGLVEQSSPAIMGLIYSIVGDWETARDLTQETFLKAYLNLNSLHTPERFGSWLRQIAANLARTHLRENPKYQAVALDDSVPAEERGFDRAILKQEVLRRLHTLPEGPRSALVMHYLLGLSPAEAARELGVSRTAFDTRVSRGREMLRKALLDLVDEALSDEKNRVGAYLAGLSAAVKASLAAEPRERAAAVRELALLAARANLPRLGVDLESLNDSTRRNAAQLLGQTGDPRSVPYLLKALAEEEKPEILCAVCHSLAAVGSAQIGPKLAALSRNTADISVHKAATDAAKALEQADHLPQTGRDIPVSIADLREGGMEDLLLQLLLDPTPTIQMHAMDGLGRVESLKAVEPLLTALRSTKEGYVRLTAAAALGGILSVNRTSRERINAALRSKAVQALALSLSDSDPGVVAEAARALSQIGYQGEMGLRQEVMEQVFAVLDVLVRKPGPWWGTFPALLGVFGVEADLIRVLRLMLRADLPHPLKGPLANAVERMAAPGQRDAVPLLLEVAQKGIMAKAMVVALGQTQDPSAVSLLVGCLSPTFPIALQPLPRFSPEQHRTQVRQAAATALAGLADGQALLIGVWHEWQKGTSMADQPALLALLSGLDAAGAPAEIFEAIADTAGVETQARMAARVIAQRRLIHSA